MTREAPQNPAILAWREGVIPSTPASLPESS